MARKKQLELRRLIVHIQEFNYNMRLSSLHYHCYCPEGMYSLPF
jgi:hypothetical protein